MWTQREDSHEDMEAEPGVVLPQTTEYLGPLEAERDRKVLP